MIQLYAVCCIRGPCVSHTPLHDLQLYWYDEYEPGKVITWWSVSSCTSEESVARNFMQQLGGAASLIVLKCKRAMDITPLSVYPNEKESLLAPGTRLKVLSRKKVGKVNEIHVEEVGSALDDK